MTGRKKSMDIFDKMEPYRLAEQLAYEADRRAAALPKCERCGRAIADSKLLYIPEHDEFYCLDCVDAMTEINEAAEVE
jgi:hypothetical protein